MRKASNSRRAWARCHALRSKARARVWLPEMVKIIGAKPPRRFPPWLARVFAGEAPVVMATESRGASNAKAKRELGWSPAHPSWRHGFTEIFGPTRTGES